MVDFEGWMLFMTFLVVLELGTISSRLGELRDMERKKQSKEKNDE